MSTQELVFSSDSRASEHATLKLVLSRWDCRRMLNSLVEFFTESRPHESSKTFWVEGSFLPLTAVHQSLLDRVPEELRSEVRSLAEANVALSRMVDVVTDIKNRQELLASKLRERAEAAEAELKKILSGECTAS